MATAVSILPGPQLAALNEAYRRAVARKRLRMTLAAAVFFAALVVAAIGAEVNLRTFFTYFGNFVSYFDRIFTLENGAGSGPTLANGLGLAQMVAVAGRDDLDQLCRHAVRGRARLCAEFSCGGKYRACTLAAHCDQAPDGILPDSSRYCFCGDLRHRVRSGPNGGRSRHHDPLRRRAWQAILGDCREYRHEAG